jgi:hypothetical protein
MIVGEAVEMIVIVIMAEVEVEDATEMIEDMEEIEIIAEAEEEMIVIIGEIPVVTLVVIVNLTVIGIVIEMMTVEEEGEIEIEEEIKNLLVVIGKLKKRGHQHVIVSKFLLLTCFLL